MYSWPLNIAGVRGTHILPRRKSACDCIIRCRRFTWVATHLFSFWNLNSVCHGNRTFAWLWKLGQRHFWTQLPLYVNLNEISFLAAALAKPSRVFAEMPLTITNNETIYRRLTSQPGSLGCSTYLPLPPCLAPAPRSHCPLGQSFTKPCAALLLFFLGPIPRPSILKESSLLFSPSK